MEIPINYIAVIVAAIAQMALGFIWYGPLFGKQWTTLMGWSEAELKAGQEKMQKEGWKTYGLQLIGAVVMAYVLAHVSYLALIYASSPFHAGISSAFWMWLGFIAPVMLGSVLWDGKSWKLFFLQSGYYLVGLLIMGAIIGSWF
ncbi:MAG: DUF1761 domain-containing protein [Minisyncoccia bacterium]